MGALIYKVCAQLYTIAESKTTIRDKDTGTKSIEGLQKGKSSSSSSTKTSSSGQVTCDFSQVTRD